MTSPRPGEQNGDFESVEIQDSAREALMRALFRLTPSGEGRMGADAHDEYGNPFELKSTTTRSVTTARDVGPHTIEKWRQRYWLAMKGRNLERGFIPEEIYFLHPRSLEEWLSPLSARLSSDLDLLDRVSKTMARASFTKAEVARLRSLARRGMTINNPKIPWSYIREHGIRIDGDYANRLRELVSQYPLDSGQS